MASSPFSDTEFPYSLYDPTPPFAHAKEYLAHITWEDCNTYTLNRTISLPLPTHRLASFALQTLEVDTELSPFVRRTFALTTLSSGNPSEPQEKKLKQDPDESKTVLQTTYRATTNRMLRVAVNGFMESLGVVLGVMAELDVDVLKAEEVEG